MPFPLFYAKWCNVSPPVIAGLADIFAGKWNRSIGHFCFPYFTKVHGRCFFSARHSDCLVVNSCPR